MIDNYPNPCLKYLLLIGTTGTYSAPDDNVFPNSVFAECDTLCIPYPQELREYTFNRMQQESILYPLPTHNKVRV